MRRILTSLRVAAAIACLFAGAAMAQGAGAYPSKPIRLVVPFAAGGTADVLARIVSQQLTPLYGQQIVVETRPGSGGNLGAESVAKAAPDGHTLLLGTIGIHAAYRIYSKLGYDPAQDLQPVILLADLPCVLIVHPSVPATNLKEFIALAKGQPGQLNFGSAGNGSSTHMIGELFKLVAGVNLTHIPYKGSSLAMNDLIGGQIQLMFENLPTAIPQVKSGKVRAIGLTGRTRSPSLPEVPTIAESGLEAYSATAWFTIAAPRGVPAEIIRKLNGDIATVIRSPEMATRWRDLGVTPMGGTPEAAAQFFATETEKWTNVIRTSGIRSD
jgi:tripartite-type tricarboxylate transporter receptor subunit TctC